MNSNFSFRLLQGISNIVVLCSLLAGPLRLSAQSTSDLPVVGVRADPATTSEPIPGAMMIPGKFIISRTGSTAQALTIHLQYAGTASAADYQPLPSEVVIPVGTNLAQILVFATSDDLVEGTETVGAKIVLPPASANPLNTLPPYSVDPAHASAEVDITDYIKLPTVSLEATTPETAEPSSNVRVAPGVFTVSRTGSTTEPLTVYLHFEGSATAGQDYKELPQNIVIPAAASQSELLVEPIDDTLVEGDETVVASLPLVPFAFGTGYSVDSARAQAKVVIHDNDSANPQTVVRITAPDPEGTELSPLVAVIDPASFEITRDGPTNNSLLVFFSVHGTATEGDDYPKLPSHTVSISAGERTASITIVPTADSLTPNEQMETVGIRLEPSPQAGPLPSYEIDPKASQAAAVIYERTPPEKGAVEIALPGNGESFPVGAEIHVTAAAYHPSVALARLVFYADDQEIGVSEIAPNAASTGGLYFHNFTWVNANPGTHVLTAKATLPDGTQLVSSKIQITVGDGTALPVVSIRYVEPQTEQPWPNADYAPGVLVISRTGATNDALLVYFDVGGTATPGVDYEKIDPHSILIPAGALAAYLKVTAIDDTLVEGNETVQVTLMPQPPTLDPVFRAAYTIDPKQNTAAIIIYDNDQSTGSARIEITKPANGDVFAPGVDILINAVAIDPNGYLPRLEFHADDKLIGVSQLEFFRAPDPGTPIYHSMVWTNPPAGDHTITASGVDSSGKPVVSDPVRISVRPGTADDQVVLTVTALDPSAAEVGADGQPDPGVFVIQRIAGRKDVAVEANFTLSGTAQNGVDYANLLGSVQLPAGEGSVQVVVKPIADALVEGEETVILTLIPPPCVAIFPPPPECYRVGDSSSARVVIRDSTTGGNIPPKVAITRPSDGTVFILNQNIEVRAEAADADGSVPKLEILADDGLLGSTSAGALTVIWSNAPAGPHVLRARATDHLGAEADSTVVRILVQQRDASAFVSRELPPGYSPGVAFMVTLQAAPARGTRAYAVEDLPPKGWQVSEISNDGVFDAQTGKVKFGPYTDDQARTLTYKVAPPATANGRYEFGGSSSANDQSFPIAGDRLIESASPSHPADQNNDLRMTIDETTAYSASWKAGESWATPPNPIPLTYVTRAAMLWRQGESYQYDASKGTAPLCWVSSATAGAVVGLATGDSAAVRSNSAAAEPGRPLDITVALTPAANVTAYAVEEVIPEGWTVSNVSDEGVFDAGSRTIRWGVFLDAALRTVKYTLTAPANVTSIAGIRGNASFDGTVIPVVGVSRFVAVESSSLLRLPGVESAADGLVHLQLAGPAGQTCVLEVSSDLNTWTELEQVYLPDGQLDYQDASATNAGQRYYRLRVR
ncbi:MAG TPA: Calx-beta domain-containing protein [Verrucomicrobiae bacterium]|nr:Calx-beta domain-containing protein [Verrucomicrobiae bacterium]